MQNIFFLPEADGVAGVGATLVTGNDINMLREHVHDLPFTFIAPLGANDDLNWHEDSGVCYGRSVVSKERSNNCSSDAIRSRRSVIATRYRGWWLKLSLPSCDHNRGEAIADNVDRGPSHVQYLINPQDDGHAFEGQAK